MPSGRWISVRNGSAGSRASRTPARRPDTGRCTSSGSVAEDRGQRVELARAAPGEGLGRGVRVDDAIAVEQHEGQPELALGAHERLVEIALLAQGLRRLGAIGHVGDGDADAQPLAARERHRVVAGDVVAVAAGLAPRLAHDLEVDDRLAGRQHLVQRGLDVGGQRGQHLAHGAPDVVDGRDAVDLGQRVVDADVAEVGVEEALADRRRIDEGIEQRLGLARVAFPGARLAVQARVVEGEGGAPCHLPHEGDVVLVVAGVPAGARERDRAEHVPAGAQRHHQHRVRPSERMSSRCSASRAPATICSSLIRASSSGWPVRTTCAVPPPARERGG